MFLHYFKKLFQKVQSIDCLELIFVFHKKKFWKQFLCSFSKRTQWYTLLAQLKAIFYIIYIWFQKVVPKSTVNRVYRIDFCCSQEYFLLKAISLLILYTNTVVHNFGRKIGMLLHYFKMFLEKLQSIGCIELIFVVHKKWFSWSQFFFDSLNEHNCAHFSQN